MPQSRKNVRTGKPEMNPKHTITAVLLSVSLPVSAASYITAEQAAASAKTKVKNAEVRDVDFEREGRPYYDVELVADGKKYGVRVDAQNGRAVITDAEPQRK